MRHVLMAALLCSTATSLCAQTATLRPFVGIGYTSGGETMVPVTIRTVNSSQTFDEDISAGGGIEGRVGLALRPEGSPFSARFSYGIHNDQSNGISNDRVFFRRYPVELIGFYHFTDRASLGIGLRQATRAALRYKNATISTGNGTEITGYDNTFAFKSHLGAVIEGEWRATPSWGLSVRYVREHFTYEGVQRIRVDADHLGVNTQWYFR